MAMKAKLFIRIFLGMAIPFGIVMGGMLAGVGVLVDFASEDIDFSVPPALIGALIGIGSGVFFGMVMSLILGVMHFTRTDTPYVRHRRTYSIGGSLDEAKSICVEAVMSISGATVNRAAADNSLLARTGVTWQSFGETIECSFEPAGPNRQIVSVESRPVIKTTLVDYGRNLENIEAISVRMKELGASELENMVKTPMSCPAP